MERTPAPQGELDLGLPPAEPAQDLAWPAPGDVSPAHELPAGGLDGHTTSLFVQATTDEAPDVARLVEHAEVGVVLTVPRRRTLSQFQQALGAASALRRRTPTNSILVDRALYSGKRRKSAEDGLDAQWVMHQHRHMKLPWALTDSGYAPTLRDVERILTDSSPLPGRVVAALPIPATLLRDEAPAVADRVREQRHPVAVMLEHEGDPFDEPGVAAGLVHLIGHGERPVLLLRSDTSALGAISHGAAVGAVGTTSGLRHIYPSREGGAKAQLAFVIPELLGYFRQRRFEQAYLRDPSHSAWSCGCWFCGGRDLTWIGNQPELLKVRGAARHSVAAVSRLGNDLATSDAAGDLVAAWSRMCSEARERHEEIANPSGSPWEPKDALLHWQALRAAVPR